MRLTTEEASDAIDEAVGNRAAAATVSVSAPLEGVFKHAVEADITGTTTIELIMIDEDATVTPFTLHSNAFAEGVESAIIFEDAGCYRVNASCTGSGGSCTDTKRCCGPRSACITCPGCYIACPPCEV